MSDPVLTAAQMQAAEQALIDGDETVESLMERAGMGAADWIWRVAAGRSVTVLCGPGNNGGDGYVIARVLAERGLSVAVIAPLEPATDAARAARGAWGGEVVAEACGSVLVDCLFGTGLSRPLGDDLLQALSALADAHPVRLAVDLPSGVDSDTGATLNDGLPHYDLTLALGAWKRAHWLMPASALMGERRLVDIGIGAVGDSARLAAKPVLGAPAADAHKYTRGLVAVVGGAMPGAAMLASRAALHGGAGYVKLMASHKTPASPDEIVLEDGPLEQALSDDRIAAVLVGPGLGRDAKARTRLHQALDRDAPTVCDADGLVLLEPRLLEGRSAPLLLTPHEGELTKLAEAFGCDGEGKVARAQAVADAAGAHVLAKGPDSVLVSPGEPPVFFQPGSSWLSTAGTGDVLAGLVASRLVCGDAGRAVEEAFHLHAEAARLAGPVFSAGDFVSVLSDAYRAFL